jgi:alpha-glucosidase
LISVGYAFKMADHWIKTSVVYHLYVRSFKDSHGDGVGDLRGIIEKLDYLAGESASSLGVNAIWLSPIYLSPMADCGYDVADHTQIDPLFGSLADFDELIKKAHQHDVKILMDFIPNHTSSEHQWFKNSSRSRNNPKREWYLWQDPQPDGSPPSNWLSVFGGSAWQWDEATGQYYLHTFDSQQPDLNWRNPEVVEAMMAVFRFWLDRGVDGFRIDAYDYLFKDPLGRDEPSNPEYDSKVQARYYSLQHLYTFGLPETLEVLKQFTAILDEYGHKFMITEVYAAPDRLLELYRTINKEWYSTFNFSLITQPWKASVHKKMIDDFDRQLGPDHLPSYVLGNHDNQRLASRIGRAQARNAAILLFTLRGLPFIYYGDELGMTDGEIPPEKVHDTFEIHAPGLGLGRDPERTPMQWDATKFAGFSMTEPWLPVNDDYPIFNVEAEAGESDSFLKLYQKLIDLKLTAPALLSGEYQSLASNNISVFAFVRTHDQQRIVVVLNYSARPQKISLPSSPLLGSKQGRVVIDSLGIYEGQLVKDITKLSLQPNQGLVIECSNL